MLSYRTKHREPLQNVPCPNNCLISATANQCIERTGMFIKRWHTLWNILKAVSRVQHSFHERIYLRIGTQHYMPLDCSLIHMKEFNYKNTTCFLIICVFLSWICIWENHWYVYTLSTIYCNSVFLDYLHLQFPQTFILNYPKNLIYQQLV